jgi:hypothetical protein
MGNGQERAQRPMMWEKQNGFGQWLNLSNQVAHNFWISKVQSCLPEAFASSSVVEKSGPIISESWQLWESYPAPSDPPELMRSEKRERGHRCDEDILAPWQGLPAFAVPISIPGDWKPNTHYHAFASQFDRKNG